MWPPIPLGLGVVLALELEVAAAATPLPSEPEGEHRISHGSGRALRFCASRIPPPDAGCRSIDEVIYGRYLEASRIKLGGSSLVFVLGKLDPNLDLNLSKNRPYTYIRTASWRSNRRDSWTVIFGLWEGGGPQRTPPLTRHVVTGT